MGRQRPRATRTDTLFPDTTLFRSLAIIVVYGGVRDFRISLWFIIAGHVIFTLPFMVRSVAAACASQHIKLLEEGAASLGAHFFKRFTTVVVPNIPSGILAGALMFVTLSLAELHWKGVVRVMWGKIRVVLGG